MDLLSIVTGQVPEFRIPLIAGVLFLINLLIVGRLFGHGIPSGAESTYCAFLALIAALLGNMFLMDAAPRYHLAGEAGFAGVVVGGLFQLVLARANNRRRERKENVED